LPAPGNDAVLRFLGVETIETHMSWLFVVGEQVLKLKKPVR